jgi:hypothetical protein
MPMTAFRRLFRYFALALASIQVAAFAGSPALEAALVVVPQAETAVSADEGGSDRSIPRHDPGSCVVCQLISVVAALPVPPTVVAPVGEISPVERPRLDAPRQHSVLRDALSRAPPAFPA